MIYLPLTIIPVALYAWFAVYVGRRQTKGAMGATIFRVPEHWPWRWWPERSMTLLLPFLGVTVFAHPLDCEPYASLSRYAAMIAHEWLGHKPQFDRLGYRFYLYYAFPGPRLELEAEAFAHNTIMLGGSAAHIRHYARGLNKQYGTQRGVAYCEKRLRYWVTKVKGRNNQ